MKNATLVLSLFAMSTCTFAQQLPTDNESEVKNLMHESKVQKNAGTVLLISGVVVGASGWIIATSDYIEDLELFESSLATGLGVMFVGGLCIMGSIEFYKEAKKTRKDARQLSVLAGYDRTSPFALGNRKPVYYPAVRIRLRIP
ncbi:MAG: hypothetical protein MUE58_08005 [Chitinophagaceae bacterium]|jgi:hypothetical protein|nr:hypothetical protein [Chitinophagaceae bacterium]